VNRLATASENGGAVWSQTYGYDRYGNRWVSASPGYTLSSLTPQSLGAFNAVNNRLFASVYDGAGNQTTDGQSRTFTYDAENRQTAFNGGTGQYFYDGDGRRVKKIDASGTTVFVYNAGGQLIAEYHSDPVPPPAGGGGTSYLTIDHLGSTRVVTKQDGTIKARYDYLPFGEELGAGVGARTTGMGYSLADSTNQKFTQKERDTESGLDYFLARYYSSAQGRFTSPDPIFISDQQAYSPQLWNLYNYAGNNPLAYTDPTGMELVRLGQHSDEEIEKRQKQIDAQKKLIDNDKSLTKDQRKEQKKALDGEKKTLGLEKEGNKVVGQYLASLDTKGERNGLQLGDFTLSTDSKMDFKSDPRVSDDPGGGAQLFVLLGYSTQIYVNTASSDYKGAKGENPIYGASDFITYNGTAARHEQFHRDSADKSEHAAYAAQLKILQKFGPDAFKSKEFYNIAVGHVTTGSNRKD
jgi:RHS repeat-associated protein